MYTINNTINSTLVNGLKVTKLAKSDRLEVLLITLEKDHIFPNHSSPWNATLVVLEGEIDFKIRGTNYRLSEHNTFQFPADTQHSVYGVENSKFIIIRSW